MNRSARLSRSQSCGTTPTGWADGDKKRRESSRDDEEVEGAYEGLGDEEEDFRRRCQSLGGVRMREVKERKSLKIELLKICFQKYYFGDNAA